MRGPELPQGRASVLRGSIQEPAEDLVDVPAGSDEMDLYGSFLGPVDHTVAGNPQGTEPGQLEREGVALERIAG